ncbi:uncharacterized protein LOC135487250 isoform X2 [Lineus longissimus]|uniref:uncharacterized protein LOC135487250 isoform X2 n=1 Tax=Lineus longissimus TaxID=88925 RepID=UPI00315C76A3
MQSSGSDRTASAHPSTPAVWLKEGHSLRGRDMFPVAARLVHPDEVDPENFASLSRRYPLTSYSFDDLGSEFKKLTGYDITAVLGMAQMDDSICNRSLTVHHAVLQANLTGAPAGQTLQACQAKEKGQKRKAPEAAAGAPPNVEQGADNNNVPAPHADNEDPAVRLKLLEGEVKRIRQTQEGTSVQTALSQVRTLALRTTTPNGVLLASLESLYDTAVASDHTDKELYKMALKSRFQPDRWELNTGFDPLKATSERRSPRRTECRGSVPSLSLRPLCCY